MERTARSSRAVERTLTDGERAALGPDRHLELLRVWCRKEALAKAIGGGLGWAPEEFDTSRPDGFALIDLELEDGGTSARWRWPATAPTWRSTGSSWPASTAALGRAACSARRGRRATR